MDHWRGFYRMASHGTHANPKGVTWNIQDLSTVDVVWAGPSNAGLVDPAQCTLIALTSLTAGLLAYAVGELPDSADYWIPNLSIAHVRHQTIRLPRLVGGAVGVAPAASSGAHSTYGLALVGGHEILPSGGHVAARWRPTVLPSGGQQSCPR